MVRLLVTLAALVSLVTAASSIPIELVGNWHESVVSDAPTDSQTHYGDPTQGCLKDEHAFEIVGVPGRICAAKCTEFLPCPTDVPEGVTAKPMCALKSPTGDEYCVLICTPKMGGAAKLRDGALQGGECGAANCHDISGRGVCTYGA